MTEDLSYNGELLSDEPQVFVQYSQSWVKFLVGVALLLTDEINWRYSEDLPDAIAEADRLLAKLLGEDIALVPTQQFGGPVALSWQYLSQSLAPTSYILNSAVVFGGYCYQTTPSDAQNVYQFRAWLVPGDYTLRIWYYSTDTSAILAVSGIGFVGHLLGTRDFYSSPPVPNNYYELDFEWTETGECLFVFTTSGKNAASSNYYLIMQAVELVRDV